MMGSPSSDSTQRIADALARSARRARRVAAQTNTRLVVYRDGAVVAEHVEDEDPPSRPRMDAS